MHLSLLFRDAKTGARKKFANFRFERDSREEIHRQFGEFPSTRNIFLSPPPVSPPLVSLSSSSSSRRIPNSVLPLVLPPPSQLYTYSPLLRGSASLIDKASSYSRARERERERERRERRNKEEETPSKKGPFSLTHTNTHVPLRMYIQGRDFSESIARISYEISIEMKWVNSIPRKPGGCRRKRRHFPAREEKRKCEMRL